MIDLDEFKADLLGIRDDLPVTFNYGGTSYTGFAGQKTTGETLEVGGYLDNLERSLNVCIHTQNSSGSFVNTFAGATPTLGDTLVIVSDGTYKVGNVRRAQDGLLLTYGLMTVNR